MHWLECTGQVTLRDVMGNGLRARGVLVDVSTRKASELATAQHMEELDRLAHSLERQLGETMVELDAIRGQP